LRPIALSHLLFFHCGENRRASLKACRIGFLSAGFSLLLGLSAVHAAEAPRTINDCEKIQAADAYNQCLASFGPVAHERGAKVDPEGTSKLRDSDFKDAPPVAPSATAAEVAPDPKEGPRKSRRTSRSRSYDHYGTHLYGRQANGRKSIQFDIR